MADAGGAKSAVTVLQDDGELPELSTALPKRHGIPPSPVHLWCVAGSNDILVLGTNHSLVIVHHLRSLVTDKVSLEGSLKRSGVTTLCLFPAMYNRIAMGRQHGLINIYQFADTEAHKRRSMVKKIHSTSIKCLAWDTRGALLFSADEGGMVYATEVDMKEGKHYSWLVYESSSPIVEISYSSMMLLVSSTASSVICHIARDVTQRNPPKVGSKDRKVGEYGGCFATLLSGEEASLVLYVTRPGLRIWRADHTGTVKATLKFKDIFEQGNVPPIKVLGRRRESSSQGAAGDVQQLGRLRYACRKFLLAWHGDSLWLLNPETGQISGFTSGLGQILDLCVHKGWVFILREPPYARQSPIIRFGFDPSLVPHGSSPSLPLFRDVGDSSAVRASESLLGLLPVAGSSSIEAVKSGDAAKSSDAPSTTASEAGKTSTETQSEGQVTAAAAAAVTAVPESTQTLREGTAVDDALASVVQQEAVAARDRHDEPPNVEEDDHLERQQQKAVVPDMEESQAVVVADVVQAAADTVVASAAASSSPCPSPVLASKTASTTPAVFTAPAAHVCPPLSNNSSGGSGGNASVANATTSTTALSTSPDGPTMTAPDGVLARGEDVAQGTPSSTSPPSPRSVRARTPPSSEPNATAASSSPSPMATAASSTTAVASSSRSALRYAADSKTPVIPPQFDISLDDSDTAVLIKPKAKRKGKKTKKSDSSSAIGIAAGTSSGAAGKFVSTPSSPGSSRASPARSSSPVRQPIVWVPSASGTSADVSPRDSAAEQPYALLQPKGDVTSASERPSQRSRSTAARGGVEDVLLGGVASGNIQSVERTVDASTQHTVTCIEAAGPAPDSGAGAVDDHVTLTATLASDADTRTSGGPPSSVVAAATHRPADAGAGPAIDDEAGIAVEGGAMLTDGIDRVHVEHRSEACADSLTLSPGFQQLMSSKSNPVLAISNAELQSAEPVELEMHPLASERHPDDADTLEASDDNSSGANSVHNSGEHNITSIYDMGRTESEDTHSPGGDAVAGGSTEAHDIFVPSQAKQASATSTQRPAAAAAAAATAAASADGTNSKGSAMLGGDGTLGDSWVQCPAPCRNPLAEILCTPTHIWAVDTKDYVYTWSLGKRRWINLKGSVRHMSASPSGDVIWACSKSGSLYHRAGIDRRTRIGTEWRKMDMKVKSIAVDNKRSWVLTANGSVKLRRDVTLAVPTGQQWDDMPDVPNNLRYLTAGHGVLWAITTHNVVLARLGISRHKPLGTSWEMVCPGQHFQHVAIGIHDTAWLVNDEGVVCFMHNVCLASPCGDSQLWLSGLGQFVVHDASLLEALWTWSLVKRSEPLRYVAAGLGCVAVLNATPALLYAGGSMVGTAYRTVSPPGVAVASMTWISISASSVHSNGGRVWMLQRNGEVFCVKSGERPMVVQSPGRQQLTQVSSSFGSIWAVTSDGQIVERKDVNDYCPTGTSWQAVPVTVLRGAKVRHISCGLYCAWAVDERGQAWLRLGELGQMSVAAAAAASTSLWQAVEAPTVQCKFTQVVVGPGGWHVWAVDTTGCTHARIDVGIDNPAGASWQSVGGVNVSRLCISNSKVWAICANGDLVWRSNVTPRNPTGDYWKRIPGHFSDLSVTPDDVLWLIDTEGYAFRRETSVYQGSVSQAKRTPGASLDTWVVV